MTSDAVLARNSLMDEVERLQPLNDESGRRAEILVKQDDLRVTLVTMRAGVQLDEHLVPVSLSIQVLKGTFEVSYDDQTDLLGTGEFIALKGKVPHAVRSVESGAFLLTLGWPGPDGE